MDLSYLANLSEAAFESERCRLINEELAKLPQERRKEALLFQLKLDARRETMSREEFVGSLFRDMAENFENMSDQFVAIRNLAEPR